MVAAVQAGFNVAAFDIFNDVETRHLSICSEQVEFRDGGFDADDLLRKLQDSVPAGAKVIYGSGLETQPALLERIVRHYCLLGNSAQTVASVKDPRRFFAVLDELSIAYPETCFEPPCDTAGWLVKQIGGSGGTHIRQALGQSGDYYQRHLEGRPVSVLFLANGNQAEIVGYNEQWLAPAADMPFRYGGAVSNADLDASVRDAMEEAARKLTFAMRLRGLNSMDFILVSGVPFALEINPRLSASFGLYDIPDLLQKHIAGCEGRLEALNPKPVFGSKAQLIYYAPWDVQIGEDAAWPDWAVDLPIPCTACRKGEPLCSVMAEAASAAEAKSLVFARACQLDAQLRTFSQIPGKR